MRDQFKTRSSLNTGYPSGTRPSTGSDEHRFKELVRDSPVAIYTCDENGYLSFFNSAAVALWGREPELGKDLWCGSWKIFYPDGQPMPLDACPMARTLKEKTAFESAEITIERPDHSFRNLLVFPRPLFDEEGHMIGAHNTLVDITAQKQDEKNQAILTAIVESSDDAIISKNLNSIITSWNKAAERIFGYTEAEVVGKSITILIPPALQAEEDTIIKSIRAGQKIDHFQTIRMHKSGKEIPISLTISPVRDRAGQIIGASKIARDISERLNTEKIVEQSLYRLSIINTIGKAISEKLDVQAILQQVTDATTQVSGAAFGAFFYNNVNDRGESYMLYTLSGASREAFERFGMPRNTAVFGKTFSGHGNLRVGDIRKDPRYGHNAPHYGMPKGHLPVVSYMAIPVISASGPVIGGLFFGHPEPDVFTAEHEEIVSSIATQAAIAIDNSKLFEEVKALSAKKDEFIALASHELKTPLTSIKGFLQVLDRIVQDQSGKAFVNKASRQVDKLNALIGDLLDVSRVEGGQLHFELEHFDLKELVHEVIETLNYTNKTHHISVNYPEHPIIVEADKQRIEQVMINLLSNAIKYSPKAQEVWVTLERSDASVEVKVRDNGIGLTPEQQHKIFTRFYRAEGTSGIAGLGLGLYLTKEIIDRHGGHIAVTSTPGVGSEFSFSLPFTKN